MSQCYLHLRWHFDKWPNNMCCKCFSVLDTPGSLTPDDNNDAEMNNGDDVDKYYHHDH